MADYIADKLGDVPTLNAGACHDLLTRSPLHCWTNHPRLNPNYQSESNEKADIGSAAHELLIGGESRIVEIPFEDYRKNDAKALRDAAWAEGKTPVLYSKLPAVERMKEIAMNYIMGSEIGNFGYGGDYAELTLLWQEGDSWCRARPDWLTADRKWHISYKTTAGSAEPESWIRNHLTLDGYDLSAVHYERGVEALTKVDCQTVFLVQEQADPFSCSLIGLSPAMRDLASRKLDRAIALWSSSMATGKWPAYPTRICYAEPKPWEVAQQEEQELRNFELGGQA